MEDEDDGNVGSSQCVPSDVGDGQTVLMVAAALHWTLMISHPLHTRPPLVRLLVRLFVHLLIHLPILMSLSTSFSTIAPSTSSSRSDPNDLTPPLRPLRLLTRFSQRNLHTKPLLVGKLWSSKTWLTNSVGTN